MRKIIAPLLFVLLATPVLAGGMYKSGMSGGYLVMKGIAMLLGVFIFSVIFWWTHVWIVQDKGKLTKKK